MKTTGRTLKGASFVLPLLYGAVVFAPMLGNGFMRDDYTWIASAIDSARDPALLFGPPHKDFRPLAGLLFRLNLALSGLEPIGYYGVNLLLHLANVTLVMILALRLTGGSRAVALLAGAFFAGAYGSYGDAVTWISGRTGLLADLFVLSALVAWHSFLEGRRGRDYALALGCCALALLSKETAVVLVPLLALLEWARGVPARAPLRWSAVRAYLPFAALLSGYLIFQLVAVRGGSFTIDTEYVLGWHALPRLAEYLARMVLPLNATSYMVPLPEALRAPLAWVQSVLTVLVPLGWIAVLATRTPRWAKFAVLWMVLNLAPYLFFVARTTTRHLYNPSIGYCLLVAGLIAWWIERAAPHGPLRRRLPLAAAAGLLVVQAVVVASLIRHHHLEGKREELTGRAWLREKLEAAKHSPER